MKTKKELSKLYRLLLEEYKRNISENKEIFWSPNICSTISVLRENKVFRFSDGHFLREHLYQNKPSKRINKEFFNNELYLGGVNWWSCLREDVEKANEQRVLFLEKMVRITTPLHTRILININVYLIKKFDKWKQQ